METPQINGSSVVFWYSENKVQVVLNRDLKSDSDYGLMILPDCRVLGLSGNKWYPCLILIQDRGNSICSQNFQHYLQFISAL
jgi:hypothetical protein